MTPWKKEALIYFSKYIAYKPLSYLKSKRGKIKIISIRLNRKEKSITLLGHKLINIRNTN